MIRFDLNVLEKVTVIELFLSPPMADKYL